jgi:hypothetical protein
MRVPRLSIAWLMLAVIVLAADCALLRAALTAFGGSASIPVFLIGAVPVADALAVGLLLIGLRLRRDGRAGPFLCGFVAAGMAAALLYALAFILGPEAVMAAARELLRPVFDVLSRASLPWNDRIPVGVGQVVGIAIEVGAIFLVFSTPQLLLAVLGGWAARRLGIGLVRCPPGAPSRPGLEKSEREGENVYENELDRVVTR